MSDAERCTCMVIGNRAARAFGVGRVTIPGTGCPRHRVAPAVPALAGKGHITTPAPAAPEVPRG